MANGSDSGEYLVLSRVRPGLKREFEWALKTRSENGPIGRTRSGRSNDTPVRDVVSQCPRNKRFKSSGVDERDNEAVESTAGNNLEEDVDGKTIGFGEALENEVNDISRAEGNTEKAFLVSEGEEPKSGVVDIDFTSEDERKPNMIESIVRVDEAGDNVDSNSHSEPKSQALRSEEKDQTCNNLTNVGLLMNGDTKTMEAVNSEAKGLPERTPRRFTRSAMKADVPSLEILKKDGLMTEEVAESEATSSADTPAVSKSEMKMSRQIAMKRAPAKLKDLLDTGLLEGLHVRYLRGIKMRGPNDMGLRGEIKGSGILCFCKTCCGTQVVTPNQFELHAGSLNKRPPEYIFLDNGSTLREVLNACKVAPPEALEATIKHAIGCSSENQPTSCMNCKGPIPAGGNAKGMLLCNTCIVKEPESGPVQSVGISDRSQQSVSVQRSSDHVSGSAPRSKGPKGKLTRKDLKMHKLVFKEDVLPDGTALAYYACGQECLKGYKKGAGIFCFCCNAEVSPSQFEAHAGWASRRKPYLHIYTSNGVSLHELSIGLAKQRKSCTDENDDLCTVCEDGGDLLLCDNCPRAFHPGCVSLSIVPQGTWYCNHCENMFQKEKFVESNKNAIAAGRVAGVDPLEEITKRCIRIIETSETDIGGCVLCSGHNFSKAGFGPETVILCDQCEQEYHVGCLKDHNMDDLKELPEGKWFCCAHCSKIHSALQKLVADGGEKLPDSLMNLIKKKKKQEGEEEEKGGSEGFGDLDIKWRLLSGKMASDETKDLLSKAVAIFHDRFDPVADSSTSRLDLIPHMVYGSNLRDQEYGGMYCAVLTADSTIVSAALLRIFGKEVAELPLVATSNDCQGQGYFGALFSCIESLLVSLEVNDLVLPAADEAESLWTKKFGFQKITNEQLREYKRRHQLMIFQGTNMLHKPVVKQSGEASSN